MTSKTEAAPRLVIRRKFAVPRERVFAAWTQPEQMRQWAGPGEIRAGEVEADVRPGGKYRIAMLLPDGDTYVVRGVYREVRAPEFLSYTWKWEEDKPEDEVETLVSIAFNDLGKETELVLTHEQFASAESRDNHEHGWAGALDKLEKMLAG